MNETKEMEIILKLIGESIEKAYQLGINAGRSMEKKELWERGKK